MRCNLISRPLHPFPQLWERGIQSYFCLPTTSNSDAENCSRSPRSPEIKYVQLKFTQAVNLRTVCEHDIVNSTKRIFHLIFLFSNYDEPGCQMQSQYNDLQWAAESTILEEKQKFRSLDDRRAKNCCLNVIPAISIHIADRLQNDSIAFAWWYYNCYITELFVTKLRSILYSV